jgi:hypothetical protein
MTAAAFIALLVVIALLDCVSTYYLLKRGGRELNPVVDFFIDRLGLHGGLAAAKVVTLAGAFYYAEAIVLDLATTYSTLVGYAGVAAWNFWQIHLYRKRRNR